MSKRPDVPIPPGAKSLSIVLPEGLAPAAAKAPKRPTRGVPNATEARFAREHLEPLRLAGEIARYDFEGETLRLAWRLFYRPDYPTYVGDPPALGDIYEVKGARRDGRPYSRDKGLVKLKMAAAKYPEHRFYLCWPSEGGGWHVEVVPPAPRGKR